MATEGCYIKCVMQIADKIDVIQQVSLFIFNKSQKISKNFQKSIDKVG